VAAVVPAGLLDAQGVGLASVVAGVVLSTGVDPSVTQLTVTLSPTFNTIGAALPMAHAARSPS